GCGTGGHVHHGADGGVLPGPVAAGTRCGPPQRGPALAAGGLGGAARRLGGRGPPGGRAPTKKPCVAGSAYAGRQEVFMQPAAASAAKFDANRAAEYEQQSRIALAGYEACHALAACLLSAALDPEQARPTPCHVLVVGAGGTAQEIQSIA